MGFGMACTDTQVEAFKDAVDEHWDETIGAIDTLTEQWDVLTASEDLPSKYLAENARERRSLAQAMVDRLTPLRSHSATENPTARQFLETAITYWSAEVATYEAEESYALNMTAWAIVLQNHAESSESFAEFRQGECELGKVLYSNWREICEEVEDAVQVAVELRDLALFYEFRDTVRKRWREVVGKSEDIREQAETIDDRIIPSHRLAEMSSQGSENIRAFLNFLQKLNVHPALDHASTERWYRTVITYWDQELKSSEARNAYALGRADWASVERADDSVSMAYSAYLEAECALSRLHEVADADSICALAGQ